MATSLDGGGDVGSSKVRRRPLTQDDQVRHLSAVKKELKIPLLVTDKAIPPVTDKIKGVIDTGFHFFYDSLFCPAL